MDNKYSYIETIVMYLNSLTGTNYQYALKEVFSVYYKFKGKTYEMPRHYGGDEKNDGWVVEDKIFYQIYAPTFIKESLKKDIQKKFKNDLDGLLHIIFKDNKWGGKINKFIFLVNTFDTELPEDSERFYSKVVKEYEQKYNISFNYIISNNEYIKDLLDDLDDLNELNKILYRIKLPEVSKCNLESITPFKMVNLIRNISSNLNKKLIKMSNFNSYDRISSLQKIKINNLEEIKDEIENIILHLDVVDEAISIINQDISDENNFEKVKQFIISIYNKLSNELNGVNLYNRLINDLQTYISETNEVAIKTLIVYIFDKCDIFEKE